MRTRTKLAAVSGIAAMAASAGLLLGATPASAGPNCSAGYHCVYYLGVNDSARQSYYDSDTDFRNNTFNELTSRAGGNQPVHNNVVSASNSSTGGYESHYYTGVGSDWSGFIFCVNPGSYVNYLPADLQNRASSLRLRGTTSVNCF
ncbi:MULTISPECIES: hypothetical protein [unclassified Streptomyces]|jgi:hypothetical protein|uniref:hypothetical protein n=1 Tax=unclassified Streptomyces TaxID=2593676 RepID=UPI000A1E02F1|nr:hypothetical protein [Streptomyces sp. 13-12-16]OSP38251.1 hypothetical protein B7767_35890 [Streptomyces sp. 13-12-16]